MKTIFSLSESFCNFLRYAILLWLSIALMFMAPVVDGWMYYFLYCFGGLVFGVYGGLLVSKYSAGAFMFAYLVMAIPLSNPPLSFYIVFAITYAIAYPVFLFLLRLWGGTYGL